MNPIARHLAVVALMMATIATFACADAGVSAEDIDQVRQEMETAAKEYDHFATDDIISNRPTTQTFSKELIDEQARLMQDLRKWYQRLPAAKTLIDHPNARVRTLVIGSMFVSEDPHCLPLIHSLIDDRTPTFTLVRMSLNSMLGAKHDEDAQSVGEVARAMLKRYLGRDEKDFAAYWKQREQRQHCAGWFLIKLDRATRATTPLQPQYQADVQRVIEQMKQLPIADRSWTLLYVRSMELGDALRDKKFETDCVNALKQLGPERVVRFLKREPVSEDPDLWLGQKARRFESRWWVHSVHFVLNHARELLGPEDAPALLAAEQTQRATPINGVSPYWAAAAAELVGESDPEAAIKIVDDALARFPMANNTSGSTQQAVLIHGLWRAIGPSQQRRAIDWFYNAHQQLSDHKAPMLAHGPVEFLRLLRKDQTPRRQELLAALVADARFDQADWDEIHQLIDIANDATPQLFDVRRFYDLSSNRDEAKRQQAIAGYREAIRSVFAE